MVVLPAPLGPMMLNTSPGSIANETSRTAWTPPKLSERFSAVSKLTYLTRSVRR